MPRRRAARRARRGRCATAWCGGGGACGAGGQAGRRPRPGASDTGGAAAGERRRRQRAAGGFGQLGGAVSGGDWRRRHRTVGSAPRPAPSPPSVSVAGFASAASGSVDSATGSVPATVAVAAAGPRGSARRRSSCGHAVQLADTDASITGGVSRKSSGRPSTTRARRSVLDTSRWGTSTWTQSKPPGRSADEARPVDHHERRAVGDLLVALPREEAGGGVLAEDREQLGPGWSSASVDQRVGGVGGAARGRARCRWPRDPRTAADRLLDQPRGGRRPA